MYIMFYLAKWVQINGQFLYSNILKVYFAQAQVIKWEHYLRHPRELANNITSPQEAGIVCAK